MEFELEEFKCSLESPFGVKGKCRCGSSVCVWWRTPTSLIEVGLVQ